VPQWRNVLDRWDSKTWSGPFGPSISGLDVRSIRHHLVDRVHARQMVLSILSYHISRHMKQALVPILFYDNGKPAAAAKRSRPRAAAQRSDAALAKAARKRTTVNLKGRRRADPGSRATASKRLVDRFCPCLVQPTQAPAGTAVIDDRFAAVRPGRL